MALCIAFLLYIWTPFLQAANEVSRPCVFPFIFEGKLYSTCTTNGTRKNQPWCSVTSNYDKHRRWKPCTLTEYGGNSGGKPCVFPFLYQRRTYYTCTRKFSKGRFWCSTTGNYDINRKWSYCADNRLEESYPTQPCFFPFMYRNKLYTSCTTAGRTDGKLWCSVNRNYDMKPSAVFCEPTEKSPCSFPFMFKNTSYSSCTKDGSIDGQLWCATTSDYEKDSKWRACATEEYGGNSNGAPCFFPFTYKNQKHSSCTNEDEQHGRYWCATTENYDVDFKFSFCADTKLENVEPLETGNHNPPNKLCVFPFIYGGKSYSTCTTDGFNSQTGWCSLTDDFDRDQKWKYCTASDVQSQNSTRPH
ncbi:epididymal sperm-binding protein 1-like [Anolis sagrei]|uniref:epididymal sperm-binding protein 1-like n=1 Tax=Anolis sagrei TaxID=38937 RepID=UPI00351FD378